jgi:hypothetical protein
MPRNSSAFTLLPLRFRGERRFLKSPFKITRGGEIFLRSEYV